eukprot:TRINITY_DN25798_c0_g2_i1.p1 TRINITY_DN25798_c0_g2~~TRINITY_DN25798_c0_g2_i1.p1  ORF type:complete len:399 (+),score=95.18 TRINITY_DN25798_c0_g2_i1:54-1199(+)
MGRKGGGRKGFFKSVQRPANNEEQREEEGEVPTEEIKQEVVKPSSSKQVEQQGSSSAAQEKEELNSQFLKDTDDGNDREDEDDGDEQEKGGETKGQMIQRHKKELKQLKEQVKRLGKKKKDEAVKMESELLSKHQKELEELESKQGNGDTTKINNVSTSLYKFNQDDQEPSQKKLTKAQKRKQKQAEKEAEREAQIKEELDNLGTTQRQAENEKLEEILNPIGFTVFDVKPDGHCMYRALAHQLEGTKFDELRVQAADHVRKHKDEFLPFILGEIDEEEAEDPDAAFQKYCHQMEQTAAWGGQVEATAVSHQLKRCIKIYSADAPEVLIGPEYQINGQILHLVYKKHAFGLGEHYDSVTQYQQQPPPRDDDDDEDEDDEVE